MPKVTINGTDIEVDKGMTLLRAAAEAGYDVPHFCYHPSLSIPANCRMCLVEVEGWPKLQPGCHTQVSDGMVIATESERVVKARKSVLEFILVNHPVDCPICDQAGECKLQDYYVDYDAQESRLRTEKQSKVKAYPLGPEVVYDGERCILCTRCIRFCDEITASSELTIVERGDRTEIRTFPGRELDNAYSMCVVDLCPVGALTARDFRFKCRVWLLTSTESVCTGCATGCSVHLDHFRNEIQRYRPRYNPRVNDYWMCDAGRLSYKEVHADRTLEPLVNGAEVNWHAAADAVADKLKRTVDAHGVESVALVITPQATCEDLYLAKRFADGPLAGAQVYVAGKGEGEGDDFLIHADKNPNREGLVKVWGKEPAHFEAFLSALEAGDIKALYLMGVHVPHDRARFIEAIEKADLLIYQSPHSGELAERAHVVLPACTHAEKDGTLVNAKGVHQAVHQAFSPHGRALPDWQIFMRVMAAMGAATPFTFMSEIQDVMFAASESANAPETPAADSDESAAPPAE